MSEEAMSPSQMDGLLRAMKQRGSSQPTAAAALNSPAALPDLLAREAQGDSSDPDARSGDGAVTAYDFKRPARIGQLQRQTLQAMHQPIGRQFAATVAGMLRTLVDVNLVSVDQMPYGDFVFGLDNPSCFSILQPSPLPGSWALDISPSLSYAVVDRMLGGEAEPGQLIRRPLTEIENRLVGRLVDAFLQQVADAWRNLVALELSVKQVESNPQLVQLIAPNEPVVVVRFETAVASNRGLISLCIPLLSIERFNSQLAQVDFVGYDAPQPTEETRRVISEQVDVAPVNLAVTLARLKIRTADLLDLQVGDVITTDQEVSAPLELTVQGVPKFTARPGAYRGKKAVRIDGVIEP